MYELVKYVHVLCAVVWVGGAFYAQLLAIRVVRSPDPADVPKVANHIAFLAARVFIPASLLLFAAGIFMTTQRWAFQQAWISIAIVLWLVSVLTGSLYLGPRVQRVARLFESEGPTSVAGRALLDRAVPRVSARTRRLPRDHRAHGRKAEHRIASTRGRLQHSRLDSAREDRPRPRAACAGGRAVAAGRGARRR